MPDIEKSAMTPKQLWHTLLHRDPLFIFDVRNHDEFSRWHVEGPHSVPTLNLPYFELMELEGEDEDVTQAVIQGVKTQLDGQLPFDIPILAVCSEGHTSGYVAEGLRQLGYDAFNLEGGMVAWGNLYYTVALVQNARYSLYQMVRPARGCVSHVLISGAKAAVFDPGRHIEHYQQLAAEHEARIEWVLDTHLHADHLSGGQALGEQQQAPYYLHPYDAIHPMDMLPARMAYHSLEDGQTLRIGNTEVKVLHYPGHTLGMVAFLIDERYLLSGDSLFIESIARPDLGGKAKAWTPLLYESLSRMTTLADELVVLPAHFSDIRLTDQQGLLHASLGELKQHNPGLRKLAEGEEVFVEYILANLPDFPSAYIEIKRANAGLLKVNETQAQELELGKNICALK